MTMPAVHSGERPAPPGGGPTGQSPTFAPRLLTDLLDNAVARWGERIAIDFLGHRWTYGELGTLVEHAARGLQDIGVKPGDRVGLCLPNMPHYVILYFATLRIGGIVVNLNPLYVERELCHLLEDSGASVVATVDIASIHDKVTHVAAKVGVRKLIVCPLSEALPRFKSIAYRVLKRKEIAHVPHDGQRTRRRVGGPVQGGDLVAQGEEALGDGAADASSGTGHEDTAGSTGRLGLGLVGGRHGSRR